MTTGGSISCCAAVPGSTILTTAELPTGTATNRTTTTPTSASAPAAPSPQHPSPPELLDGNPAGVHEGSRPAPVIPAHRAWDPHSADGASPRPCAGRGPVFLQGPSGRDRSPYFLARYPLIRWFRPTPARPSRNAAAPPPASSEGCGAVPAGGTAPPRSGPAGVPARGVIPPTPPPRRSRGGVRTSDGWLSGFRCKGWAGP